MSASIRNAALLGALACAAVALPARADIAVTGSSEPTTYVRGRTNSYLLDLRLISEGFAGADALYFTMPAGVTLSAVRKRNTFSFCSDVYPSVMGVGSGEGGWYQLGYPALDGCGSLAGGPAPGEEQIVLIDVDVPVDYAGDLPVVVNVLGDGNGEAPNEATLTLSMTDAGAARVWTFDTMTAPALPAGWNTDIAGAATAWVTQATTADSAPNAAYAATAAASGEALLTSASMAIPADGAELQFRQRYLTESGYDGGVLEIAYDGGAFEDILAVGGQFSSGGYGPALATRPQCSADANPLAGRAAWSGTQAGFDVTTVVLPSTAVGHTAQFRWRLGSDCSGSADAAGGWWIDDVRLTSTAASVSTPAKLAVAINAGMQRIEPIEIGNAGTGTLTYALSFGSGGDCTTPSQPSWLSLGTSSGSAPGGVRDEVALTFDANGLAAGDYSSLLCVASNDAAQPMRAIPLRLSVAANGCAATDRIFANGFDDASDGRCGESLRIYDERSAFLTRYAGGYENAFNGLRTGYVNGPLNFGGGGYGYAISVTPHTTVGDMYLFPGSGVLSGVSPDPETEFTITFTGAPVTAIGANFWGQLFQDPSSVVMNLQPPTTIVLTLADGSSETFVANGQQDFRGFVTSKPITSLRMRAPEPGEDGRYAWGVFDHLIVGSAR